MIIITGLFLMILLLQLGREGAEWLIHMYVPRTHFANSMTTMAVMLVFTLGIVLLAKKRKVSLSVFPEHFGKGYVILTVIAATLLITTPSNYTGGGKAILLLIYGSIVTPIYEELIFRGYAWNRLETVLSKEVYTYVWSIALFSIWHMGYMGPQLMNGNWFAVITKMAAGLIYGVILGAIRLRYKNCYCTILVHGVLNIFMI